MGREKNGDGKAVLEKAHFYSPRATIPGDFLDFLLPPADPNNAQAAAWLGAKQVKFERTIASDEETCEQLVKELELREADPTDPDNHIALIMEWDTLYGRALPNPSYAVGSQNRPWRYRQGRFFPKVVTTFVRPRRFVAAVEVGSGPTD
jgi:hypothetical protein